MTRFTEDQSFSPALLGVVVALIWAIHIALWTFGDLPQGTSPSPDHLFSFDLLIAPLAVTGFVVALGAFFRLRTRVEGDQLIFGFPLGMRRTIALRDIRKAEAITYSPIRDFGGWGVRFGRMGRMYNARGNRAVRLELTDGTVVFVGSQRPEELAGVITTPR